MRDLLRAALHATRLGMLDMSWDVICPHCRGVRDEAETLANVPDRGACEVCEIDFETDSENALEITFHVHPSIRSVPKLYFCSAEPSTKEHIKVQLAVKPGETREVATELTPGRYRMRIKGARDYQLVDVTEDEGTSAIHWKRSAAPGARIQVTAAHTLTLENDGDEPCTFVVEEVQWADEALRPVHLFNFQEFRDLFSQEYLSTDVQLAVGEQTILFTDIVGSTAFYAAKGDPTAFMEVRKHFAAIQEAVDAHEGAVVKTIGDAVMASFTSPVQAIGAASQIHRCFPAECDEFPFRVRISLNTGPCIAVKLNANIDYFGSSVNIAAKLQAMACAGDIAMSNETYEAPGVADYLESVNARMEHVSYEIPALGREFEVHRWCTDPPGSVTSAEESEASRGSV
jgi:class 3 adenylate cyclase